MISEMKLTIRPTLLPTLVVLMLIECQNPYHFFLWNLFRI